MIYSKPEVQLLGNAASVIEAGPKAGQGDSGSMSQELQLSEE